MEAREYTEDEVREHLLSHVWMLIDYWQNESRAATEREKMEGLAFSILTALDGGTSLPGFIVAPCPHPDDKEYCRSNGENWYPENHEASVESDLGGSLHELFHKCKPEVANSG